MEISFKVVIPDSSRRPHEILQTVPLGLVIDPARDVADFVREDPVGGGASERVADEHGPRAVAHSCVQVHVHAIGQAADDRNGVRGGLPGLGLEERLREKVTDTSVQF